MLTSKAEPARQLVDNADLSWTWSVLWAVFVLKARPSWVKLKCHEWKRLWGFTVRVLFNQTNKQTNKQTLRLGEQHLRGLTIQVLFNVLKARPSLRKLKRHEWKRLWGFTARVLFNQTNKQINNQKTNKQINTGNWRPHF